MSFFLQMNFISLYKHHKHLYRQWLILHTFIQRDSERSLSTFVNRIPETNTSKRISERVCMSTCMNLYANFLVGDVEVIFPVLYKGRGCLYSNTQVRIKILSN